jgi:hypothetical protein
MINRHLDICVPRALAHALLCNKQSPCKRSWNLYLWLSSNNCTLHELQQLCTSDCNQTRVCFEELGESTVIDNLKKECGQNHTTKGRFKVLCVVVKTRDSCYRDKNMSQDKGLVSLMERWKKWVVKRANCDRERERERESERETEDGGQAISMPPWSLQPFNLLLCDLLLTGLSFYARFFSSVRIQPGFL